MNSPIQFETVAKSQYADRLHEAEIARLTKSKLPARPSVKFAKLALTITGAITVLSLVF